MGGMIFFAVSTLIFKLVGSVFAPTGVGLRVRASLALPASVSRYEAPTDIAGT
jgi:hypothetical protein